MDVFEAIKERASVRAFVPCEITEAELEQIVDAGRRAPSGHNRQPWEFIVVRDAEVLEQLGHIQQCIADASAAIAVVLDESSTKFAREDAAAAIENMLLAIVALGYCSLWVEGYVLSHEQYGKDVLGVPDHLRLLAILPVGRAAGQVSQADKKPLKQITHRDRYGRAW